jgi:NADH-quinone oxidoreductase subunit H
MDLQTFIVVAVIKIALVLFVVLTADAYIVLLERKLVARIQNRWGPNRTGPFGLLQPLADGIKFILKEDMVPDDVNRTLYILAPMLTLAVALMTIAVIPFGESITIFGVTTPLQITDVNIALLFVLGITSISVYGVALAGWSSNSKYALLGSLRASAQMISYELSLGLSLVGVLIMAQSLSLREIVNAQSGGFWHWNIIGLGAEQFPQVLGFFIYLGAAFAETNRVPFDLPEAETELVAGYHTEYSAMKFAMFFVAEYTAMITVGCIATILFLGGWHGPVFGPPLMQSLLPVSWFVLKVFFFIFLYIWIRGTLPRFRYDQLMAFGWKVLLPLAVFNVIVTAAVVLLRS